MKEIKMKRDEIEKFALSCGFVFKELPNGTLGLREYVFDFATKIEETIRESCAVKAWMAGMDEYNNHRGLPCDAREVGSVIARHIREGGVQS
jgi:hypothetical protein